MEHFSAKFAECHPVTAGWEGTWSDHPADPGGKTMYGVTEAKFHAWLTKSRQPLRPVRSITKAEALQIFYEDYWLEAGCETLFAGVDLATYDASVNSGVSRGRKWLLSGLDPNDQHDQTVRNICRKRLSFVQALANWRVFGKGWGNRIADVEAKGVARALSGMKLAPSKVARSLSDERQTANQAATAQTKIAAGAGAAEVGGAASFTLDPIAADQMAGMLLAAGLVGVAALVIWLIFRANINRQRADAYALTAKTVAAGGVV